MHGGHPQEHKNDRFGRATQHLHGVFDGGVRFMGNIRFHVVFHGYSAKGYPVESSMSE